jgi:hypothetical protein
VSDLAWTIVDPGLLADSGDALDRLRDLARGARIDVRELEASLALLSLAQAGRIAERPGGWQCRMLARAASAARRALHRAAGQPRLIVR